MVWVHLFSNSAFLKVCTVKSIIFVDIMDFVGKYMHEFKTPKKNRLIAFIIIKRMWNWQINAQEKVQFRKSTKFHAHEFIWFHSIFCVSVGVSFWGGCDGPTVSGRALHPQWRSGLLCHGLRQLGHHILCTIAAVGPVSTCLSWFYTELWL